MTSVQLAAQLACNPVQLPCSSRACHPPITPRVARTPGGGRTHGVAHHRLEPQVVNAALGLTLPMAASGGRTPSPFSTAFSRGGSGRFLVCCSGCGIRWSAKLFRDSRHFSHSVA
jgi:hypothetical protein